MLRIAITGASGFLGSNLYRYFSEHGHEVLALVRKPTGNVLLDGQRVRIAVAELSDADALTRAFCQCDAVFHTAAQFSMADWNRERLMQANVGGTRNVITAARQAGVKRLVHTSSSSALGIPAPGTVGDEGTAYNWEPYRLPYMDTKHLAEQEVLNAVGAGLDAVILNPTTIIGPGDINFNGGRWVRDMAKGKIPAWTDGGMNFVAIGDVVAGHAAALEHGRTGERYLLGGENLRYRDLFNMLAQICGRRPPTMRMPLWAFRLFGAMDNARAALFGKEPDFTPQSVYIAYMKLYFSSEKAERELGYKPSPVRAAFEEAYRWYKDRGML